MANTLQLGNGKWATGKDTVLAFNDENNNFKPLPFNFSRASSATVVNQSGLIETVGSGEPRIDFQDNTKGALLLEPSRTNVNTKSENIQDWNFASNASGEYGYEDPFKGNKAVKLTSTSDAQAYQAYLGSSVLSSGTTYTYSIYAKRGTGYNFLIDFAIPNNGSVIVDLRDGSLISESGVGYIRYNVDALSNGWYRISMVSTFDSSAYFRTGLYNQQGDCYVAFSQLEVGSYATSYIPTSGSAVTRVADVCNNGANDQVINSTEGVLYFEGKVKTDTIFAANCIAISDGTDANRLSIIMYGNINSIRASMNVGGVSQFDFNLSSGYIQEQYYKIAVSYKANDCKLFINGAKILTDTSATMPSLETFDRLNIDLGQGLYDFYGNVKDVKLYNTALTDQELAALTS
jgi:hypothetical protein